jgi:trimeric autotransporter adhesin
MTKARDIASAIPAPSTVDATELGYLDGVTSAIQTQIDSKIGSGSAINPTIVDAKGDIIAASAADTVARLAVGANDTVLTADSAEATGLKWATPSGGANWTLLNSGGTALTGADTITISGISNKSKILVLIDEASSVGTGSHIGVRLNSDTTTKYNGWGQRILGNSSYANSILTSFAEPSSAYIRIAYMSNDAASVGSGYCLIDGCTSDGVKTFIASGGTTASGGVSQSLITQGGYYNSSTVISSVSVYNSNANFDAGTVYVYASA